MLTGVHRRPPPSVTWADRNGCVLADAREPRRMRPHLSPAGPAGRCQQRAPLLRLARCRQSYPHRRSSRPDGAARCGAGRYHRGLADLPRPGEPSSRSHDVTGGGARPVRTQRLPAEYELRVARSNAPSTAHISARRFGVALAAGAEADGFDTMPLSERPEPMTPGVAGARHAGAGAGVGQRGKVAGCRGEAYGAGGHRVGLAEDRRLPLGRLRRSGPGHGSVAMTAEGRRRPLRGLSDESIRGRVCALKLGLCRGPGRRVRHWRWLVRCGSPPRLFWCACWVRVLACLLRWRAVAIGALARPGTPRPAASSVSGTGG